nr:glutamate receptor 2.8-like isoform X1 [Ipomoea trifida]
MMKMLLVLLICCFHFMHYPLLCTANRELQVGVILDSDSLIGRIGRRFLSIALSDFYSLHSNYSTRLALHFRDSKDQTLTAASSGVELLKDAKVDAIIGPQKSAQGNFVMDLGGIAKVPVISFSATSPSLRPGSPYFVQTGLSDDAQVGAIAAIVESFKWSQVVLIFEDSEFGHGIVPYLSNAFQEINVRISYKSPLPVSASSDFLLKELYKMMTMQTRVFVVQTSTDLGARLFLKAKEIGMMNEGYAWIITQTLMDVTYLMDSNVVEAMQGVLGVKPLIPKTKRLDRFEMRLKRKLLKDKTKTLDHPGFRRADLSVFGLWAYDTLWALAKAAEKVGRGREAKEVLDEQTADSLTDPFAVGVSESGPELLQAILGTRFEGISGKFQLADGKREASSFQILNVVGNGEREVAIWTPSQGINFKTNGTNFYSSSRQIFKSSVIWPGGSTAVPRGWEVPVAGKKLRVGVPVKSGFTDFVRVERDKELNKTQVSGFYIDIFNSVMSALQYAVPYELVPFEKPDGSSAGTYNDLVYQVFLQNFDAAAGDISITVNRSKYADFTLPFAEGGVFGIVPIGYEDVDNIWTFLKPLTKELWLTSIVFFVFTGMAVWILEHRVSSAFRGPPSQHVGMILYFPFSTLVFAHRERIVSNFARLVVVVWMFVVLILNSTYTASLSSRLTVQRLKPAIKDANELIKNGDFVGCPEGSFIPDLLKEKGFQETKIKKYKYPEDFHNALSNGSNNGGISAYFDGAPNIKIFLSKYCGKYTIGPSYRTDGFAFVFPRGSPLVADVSRAVIELTENGRILEIGNQGFGNEETCTGPDSARLGSTSVKLQCFEGLFAITGGITGSCLLVFLVKYVYQNRTCLQTILDSKTTVWSKVVAICRHFDQRDTSADPPRDPKEKIRDAEGGEVPADLLRISSNSSVVVPLNMEEQNNANVRMALEMQYSSPG